MKDIKKNFIYNISYQILKIILPFITMPYVSRVLGASGIGAYSYTYSIMYYFLIVAMLGINNYGNRSVAKCRDDRKNLSSIFKEIYSFQIVSSIFACILYLLYIIIFDVQYKNLALIQTIYLISCCFDINWFFFGLEKFKITVTRNIVIKIISLVFIFIFVKDSNDLWKYTLILSAGTLISQLLLWPFVNKYVDKVKVSFKNVVKHFVPCLKLFLPVIAVTIYKIMDKTMIGFLYNISDVGFYDNAEKIITVPIVLVDALGTVMLPRMTNIYNNKSKNINPDSIIKKSMMLIMFFAFSMSFGLVSIAKDFSILFFGKEFIKTGVLIQYLSVTIIFLAWGNVIRTQYLIPKEKDKEYIISAFIGAIVNFFLNIIFIPKYGATGACIGTIAAEFFVMFYQTMSVKNDLPIKEYVADSIPYMIKSIIMLIIIYPINYFKMDIIFKLIVQMIIGCFIYFLLNIDYIDSIINLKKIKNIFKRKKVNNAKN